MVVKEVFVVCQNVFCQQGQGEQHCSIGIEVRDMCQLRERLQIMIEIDFNINIYIYYNL